MSNILMIEPNYNSKYPPLGLMKIASYHKEFRGDFTWFSKGKLPKELSVSVKEKLYKSPYYKKRYGDTLPHLIESVDNALTQNEWDRVYIATLFTYEWEKTIEIIEYAKTLVDDYSKIYVGGILATLMPEELEESTGIMPILGQLSNSSMIGYEDKVNIDALTPDYSILENIDYLYPSNNAYFAYTTRGCGMNCEFCAVKTLEPNYIPYISIKEQISRIKELYGEKRDLLLMDNNVLKSRNLEEIINEIVDLGFYKGATYVNPITGKVNNRFVDFNQGLDAYLFTKSNVELLSRIAIRPARIAFDHIQEKDAYLHAIKAAVDNDITHLSNYLLYNSDDFMCKGKKCEADQPEDLYERLRINVDFQETENKEREREKKQRIHVFSFPMRYIPLNHKRRGYISKKWNAKYLRAIQAILIPTQGKGVSGKSFFDAAFGKDVDEFKRILLLPESYIATRGNPEKNSRISEEERKKRKEEFSIWEESRKEWIRLYEALNDHDKELFSRLIGKNEFNIQILKTIKNDVLFKLYLHYFGESGLITLLEDLDVQIEQEIFELVISYVCLEFPLMLYRLCQYCSGLKISSSKIDSFFKFFGSYATNKFLEIWFVAQCNNDRILELIRYHSSAPFNYFHITKWCYKLNLLKHEEQDLLLNAFQSEDIETVRRILLPQINVIFKKLEFELGKDNEDMRFVLDEAKDSFSLQIELF